MKADFMPTNKFDNARERNAYDAWSGRWVRVLAIDIGRPDDTAVPVAVHPATLDDARLVVDDASAFEHHRKKGDVEAIVSEFLRRNGPSTVREITDATRIKSSQLADFMKRRPGKFRIIEYREVRIGRAAVWALAEENQP